MRGFAVILCRQGVTKDVKDPYASDDYFRTLGEGYLAAMYIHSVGILTAQFDRLDGYFAHSDGPGFVRRTVTDLGYIEVAEIHGQAADNVSQEVGNEMELLQLENEILMIDRRKDKQEGQRLPGLPAWGKSLSRSLVNRCGI